jgi:hypothetical protein
MATADQIARNNFEERRVMYGINPVTTTPLTLRDGTKTLVSSPFVSEFYYEYANTPEFQNLNQRFVLELAQTAAKQGSHVTSGQVGIIAQKYGIDPFSMWKRQTGGGSGVNKADQVRSLSALISDMAAQYGIPFTADQVATVASIAQSQNWGREQIVDELTKNVDWYKLNAGTIKTSYEEYKTLGKQFLVNLSDASAKDWAMKVARGEMVSETVMQNIKEAAKAANPWLADYIDKGLNPIDVLAPNRDFIARNLEIAEDALDLMDQKTINMMTVQDPNGQRRLANQSEMLKQVRTDERWSKTNNAKDLTAGMGTLLARIFGRSTF